MIALEILMSLFIVVLVMLLGYWLGTPRNVMKFKCFGAWSFRVGRVRFVTDTAALIFPHGIPAGYGTDMPIVARRLFWRFYWTIT
jgi:hypothetical protein